MELPLMNPGRIHWLIVGALVLVPVLVSSGLNRCYKKRGGIRPGWGGALFVLLCWIAALALIWKQVAV